jgi:hypothetical protein
MQSPRCNLSSNVASVAIWPPTKDLGMNPKPIRHKYVGLTRFDRTEMCSLAQICGLNAFSLEHFGITVTYLGVAYSPSREEGIALVRNTLA